MSVETCLTLSEEEVIKMMLEYLQNRDLNISMLSLERETGVINGLLSDDLLFLRQLILDGQWDDAIDFIQPMVSMEGFSSSTFQYVIVKHKYLELLCIKSELESVQNCNLMVNEVIDVIQLTCCWLYLMWSWFLAQWLTNVLNMLISPTSDGDLIHFNTGNLINTNNANLLAKCPSKDDYSNLCFPFTTGCAVP